MIQEQRIRHLNQSAPRAGSYVLYWMQQSQRAECNHALEYAVDMANELDRPLVVYFGLTDRFPGANERHYHFMLEGLLETARALESRGIQMILDRASPEEGVVRRARDAAMVVVDRGYLRVQRLWRKKAAENLLCPLVQVESDVVVPLEEASRKEEYSAATFRPKILPRLGEYLVPLPRKTPRRDSLGLRFDSVKASSPGELLGDMDISRDVRPVSWISGGTARAKKELSSFIADSLDDFAELRNDPSADMASNMSPFLHFGQISPLYIALQVARSSSPGVDPFLEELVVRRELAVNFVYHNARYDTYQCLPEWCRATLALHRRDRREYRYSLEELEQARTHDDCWNAAQTEMVRRGKMHGYMRMYWGKKILEWGGRPEEAYETALHLNNKYLLDGRDPNGFAGVAWCFGKHDRPWAERPIFGTVRYMNERGLRRKFGMDDYIDRVTRTPEGG